MRRFKLPSMPNLAYAPSVGYPWTRVWLEIQFQFCAEEYTSNNQKTRNQFCTKGVIGHLEIYQCVVTDK